MPTDQVPVDDIDVRLARARALGNAPNLPTPTIWNPSHTLRPFQRVGAAHLAVKKRFVLGDPTGCHPKGELILTYAGDKKPVEEIKVGDLLMGDDGSPREVLSLIRGEGRIYEVTPVKGESFRINEDHILSLQITGEGGRGAKSRVKGDVVDVSLKDWLLWPKTWKHVHKLFRSGPLELAPRGSLSIDPYFLGLLLGDGSFDNSVILYGDHPVIAAEAEKQAVIWHLEIGMKDAGTSSEGRRFVLPGEERGGKNPLQQAVRSLGLYHKSGTEKFVPEAYKYTSIEARKAILAGYLDTDGEVQVGFADAVSISKNLCDDMAFIASSLGFYSYVRPVKKASQNGTIGDYYRLSITGDVDTLPLKMPWKIKEERSQVKDWRRTGFRVTPQDVEPYYGFQLDGNQRYVLGNFIVTHNSGKTPQELFAWALIRDIRIKAGECTRLWIVTTKAATKQGEDEVHKFLLDLNVYRLDSDWDRPKRIRVVREWTEDKTGAVLISNWAQFSLDWKYLKQSLWPWYDEVDGRKRPPQWLAETQVTLDEAQKIKNPKSQLGQTAREILTHVDRAHGLTATLVKNKAHDAQAVVETICPGTIELGEFEGKYCIKQPKRVRPKGYARAVTIMQIVGYRELDDFRSRIKDVYLGRSDDEIEAERPDVTFMKRTVRPSASQRRIYLEAEQGILVDTDGEVGAASIAHAFQASTAPEIFSALDPYPFSVKTENNAKAQLLLELLEDEEALKDEPVVIYSPLETIISAYEKLLVAYKPVRVTGKENDLERESARLKFQNGETNIILITSAGGEALNLQRGHHVIFLTRPFDPGTYIQVIGRIRRFGSIYKKVVVWHLDVEDTIDQYVDAVLSEKFGPVEEIVKGRGKLLPETQCFPREIVAYARKSRLRDKK